MNDIASGALNIIIYFKAAEYIIGATVLVAASGFYLFLYLLDYYETKERKRGKNGN